MINLEKNILWHNASVNKYERCKSRNQKSCVIWFTGLSGSGKSTLANAVDRLLQNEGKITYVLDGDNIRHGLNKDLGFSDSDRRENIRRIGEVAKLFIDSGTIVSTAFISPFSEDRDTVRDLLEKKEFIEVYVKCSIEECERRDVKGLYKKAREGKIKNFTGIDSSYEEPSSPEIIINTETENIETSLNRIIDFLKENKYLN